MTTTTQTLVRVALWAFIPFIIASLVHVATLMFDITWAQAPTKNILMPLLAFAVFMGAKGLRRTAAVTLLLIAIGFSWLGDSVGTFMPFLPTLPMMLAFFGLAHIAYMVLFARHIAVRKLPLWAVIAVIVWWGAMVALIAPHAGNLAIAVAIYGLVLGGTAMFAARCRPLVLVGAIFFLTSDSLLAFLLFRPEIMPSWTDPAVMFTYCLGQGLIAAGALATLRARQAGTLEA